MNTTAEPRRMVHPNPLPSDSGSGRPLIPILASTSPTTRAASVTSSTCTFFFVNQLMDVSPSVQDVSTSVAVTGRGRVDVLAGSTFAAAGGGRRHGPAGEGGPVAVGPLGPA